MSNTWYIFLFDTPKRISNYKKHFNEKEISWPLENRQKINVNDRSFNVDMTECLNDQKLSILGKIKNTNNNNINDNSNYNSKDNNMN